MNIRRTTQDRRLWLAVLVASLLTLVAALSWGGGQASPVRAVPEPVPTVTPAAATPTKPAERPQWTARPATPRPPTAPDTPRELVVDRLDLTMPVVPVGVAEDGQMALPERPTAIGWYRFGPRPGAERGSAVLAGHVDTKEYGVGPLRALRTLRPGDRVTVRTDGRPHDFEVRSVRTVAKQDLALAEVFDRSAEARLQILTCGGAYLPEQGGYQDNVVVTAVPR